MTRVETSIDIAASPEDVWDVVTDPRRLEDWVTIHRELKHADGGETRPGYGMEQVLCLRGAKFKVSWEVDDCTAPERLVWRGKGPARSKATTEYHLDDDGNGGTLFHYVNEFNPPMGPLGSVAARAVMGGLPEREAHRSLQRLKALLES